MRRLGTLPDRSSAELLHDHLYTLGIGTKLDRDGAEWALWVQDEDQVPQAKAELAQFRENPADPRYAGVNQAAEALRNQRVNEALAAREKQINLTQRWQGVQQHLPVTALLILLSVWVAVVTKLGGDQNANVRFFFAEWHVDVHSQQIVPDGLGDTLFKRQVYRWISPIFLHFGPWHLMFNMSATLAYGRAIEQRSGSLRFLGIVLVIALISNTCQALMMRYQGYPPTFGGMSGVDFGLFGFLWMKSRFAPEYGVWMGRDYVLQSLFFLGICVLGVLGSIANTAHFIGMFTGMALALIPVVPRIWRRYKSRL